MKKVIVLGAGGHAKAMLGVLESMKAEIHGLIDIKVPKWTTLLAHYVLGDESLLNNDQANSYYLALGIGNRRSTPVRKNIFDKFKAIGFEFITAIHSSSIVHYSVNLAEGSQVMAGVIIQPMTHVGENTILNTGSIIEHDCHIGAHCHIASGAMLGGGVKIGENSFVGSGAIIMPEVVIGSRVTIGSGSVVLKNVADGETVVGVPARILKS